MQHIISLLPVIPVRAGASEKDEMVTQMIFGEQAVILEKHGKWCFIELAEDGYRGWLSNNMISEIDEKKHASKDPASNLILRVRKESDNQLFHLTAGSFLYDYDPKTLKFNAGGNVFTCQHEPHFYNKESIRENIGRVAINFTNVPYLWGGKSLFGMDCSGFIQIIFRLFGQTLPRDSRQQAELGRTIPLSESQTGDVAFFSNKEGRVTHTGLITGSNMVIHASGMVRLDRLDEKGIYNKELMQYTHLLHVVKNILD